MGIHQLVWVDRAGKPLGLVGGPDPASPWNPELSPDGTRLALERAVNANRDVWMLEIDRGVLSRFTFDVASEGFPVWSPDGRFLLYRHLAAKTGRDLWALPLDGKSQPLLVRKTEFEERESQFSPDGRWVTYGSNQSGQYEIFVQPFPGPGGTFQISTTGGVQPRWRL